MVPCPGCLAPEGNCFHLGVRGVLQRWNVISVELVVGTLGPRFKLCCYVGFVYTFEPACRTCFLLECWIGPAVWRQAVPLQCMGCCRGDSEHQVLHSIVFNLFWASRPYPSGNRFSVFVFVFMQFGRCASHPHLGSAEGVANGS